MDRKPTPASPATALRMAGGLRRGAMRQAARAARRSGRGEAQGLEAGPRPPTAPRRPHPRPHAHGPCEQGLARARGAAQQDAAGDFGPRSPKPLRSSEKIHHFLELQLQRRGPGDGAVCGAGLLHAWNAHAREGAPPLPFSFSTLPLAALEWGGRQGAFHSNAANRPNTPPAPSHTPMARTLASSMPATSSKKMVSASEYCSLTPRSWRCASRMRRCRAGSLARKGGWTWAEGQGARRRPGGGAQTLGPCPLRMRGLLRIHPTPCVQQNALQSAAHWARLTRTLLIFSISSACALGSSPSPSSATCCR